MTTDGSVALAVAGGVFLSAVIALLVVAAVRLLRYRPQAGSGSFDPEQFSIERYQPILRLASREDFDFLESQPGYRRSIGARLRRHRRRILRMYLRDLARDFRALHAAARRIVADSPERNSEFVGLLVRYQLNFWRSLILIELRLLAPSLPKLDLRPLLQPMEAMRMYVFEA